MDKIDLIGKPNYKKLTEDYNFFRLFKKIEKKFDTCFLFESLGEESYISRYHILGFDPKYIIYPTYENLIIENKNVWILDEPLSNLDESSIELMKQTFEDHCSKKGSIIFSSHQNPGIYVTEEINL